MNVFYSDSKTVLFQLFEGVQDVLSRLMAMCCMFLPHNPYRLPSTTTGTSVGTRVTENINFCGYLRFFSITFV
jgi:hypothetical protein